MQGLYCFKLTKLTYLLSSSAKRRLLLEIRPPPSVVTATSSVLLASSKFLLLLIQKPDNNSQVEAQLTTLSKVGDPTFPIEKTNVTQLDIRFKYENLTLTVVHLATNTRQI